MGNGDWIKKTERWCDACRKLPLITDKHIGADGETDRWRIIQVLLFNLVRMGDKKTCKSPFSWILREYSVSQRHNTSKRQTSCNSRTKWVITLLEIIIHAIRERPFRKWGNHCRRLAICHDTKELATINCPWLEFGFICFLPPLWPWQCLGKPKQWPTFAQIERNWNDFTLKRHWKAASVLGSINSCQQLLVLHYISHQSTADYTGYYMYIVAYSLLARTQFIVVYSQLARTWQYLQSASKHFKGKAL